MEVLEYKFLVEIFFGDVAYIGHDDLFTLGVPRLAADGTLS